MPRPRSNPSQKRVWSVWIFTSDSSDQAGLREHCTTLMCHKRPQRCWNGARRGDTWAHKELTLYPYPFQRTPDSELALADTRSGPLSKQQVTSWGRAHRTGLLESFPSSRDSAGPGEPLNTWDCLAHCWGINPGGGGLRTISSPGPFVGLSVP